MKRNVTIRKDQMTWGKGQHETLPLSQYAATLVQLADRGEQDEPIPSGVRFLIHRHPASLLVLEEPPQVRTVQWIADDSEAPFGAQAEYQHVRLAFPYVIIVAGFLNGSLTTHTQCFYRKAPLTGRGDPLLIPNLYNVALYAGFPCWLCLKKLEGLTPFDPWRKKAESIRRHFWTATFNRSASIDRDRSYYWKMKCLDPRLATLEAWETASRDNPLFPLEVPWLPAGPTVGEVMTSMLDKMVAPPDARFVLDSMLKPLMEPKP